MQLIHRVRFLSLIVVVIFLLLVIAFSGVLVQKGVLVNKPAFIKPTATFYDPNADIIKNLQADLINAPDEEARRLIEGKLAILGREATARSESFQRGAGAPRNPTAPTPSLVVEGVKITGIIDDPSVAMSSMVFRATNGWQEKIGNSWVLIIAGIFTKEPAQGVLIVDFYGGPTHIAKIIPMPTKDGTVKIIDAKGYRLTLETEGGSKYYFDVPGLSFADSLDQIIPTITPPAPRSNPTATPVSSYP